MTHLADGIWCGFQTVPGTLTDPRASTQGLDTLVIQNGCLVWLGPVRDLPATYTTDTTGRPLARYKVPGTWLTPGLVDCHTHLVYGGQRAREFAMRLEGASYEDIARVGGGIVSTVQATCQASEEQLFASAAARLQNLLAEGVCALEIKSGYGLALEHERKQLKVARQLGQHFGLDVRGTFLGAHALPPEYAGRSADYIQVVCQEMLPALAAEGLVDAVDVFCERIAFSLSETEQVFEAARQLGLPVKLHAEQLSPMGGAELAARYGALSCDHIEHLSQAGVQAMSEAGTVAVLLPGAFYALRDTQVPPIAALRAAGVPMAVSTDHNPGTSPTTSLLLMMNMACTQFRLTVAEALAGVTRHAARALGLQASHGALHLGQAANLVFWQLEDWTELAYAFGARSACTVIRNGLCDLTGANSGGHNAPKSSH